MSITKDLINAPKSDKLSKEDVRATVSKMQFKSALIERERDDSRCEVSFPYKLGQFFSKDSEAPEESTSMSRQDLDMSHINSIPDYRLAMKSAEPSQVQINSSSLKNSLGSGTLIETDEVESKSNVKKEDENKGGLLTQKDWEKITTEERKHGKPPIQAKAPKLRRMDDFLKSSTISIKGLVSEEDIECTFHPKIKGDVTGSPYLRKCPNSLPYKRLANTTKHSLVLTPAEDLNFNSQIGLVKPTSSFYNKSGSQTSKRERAGSSHVYTPQVKSNSYYKEVTDKSFKKGILDKSQFSHQPEILLVSKQRKPMTPHEMTYEPTKKKQEKLKSMRKEMMEKANKEYTFAPGLRVDAYNKVNSKLMLKDGMSTYLERIKKENEEKAKKRRLYKEIREIEEMQQCTHTPKINKYNPKHSRTNDWT